MKSALQSFWNEIVISASDPAKLAGFHKKRLSSALRYLFWFLFSASVVMTVWICVNLLILIPLIQPFVNASADELRGLYPANLEVTIEDGILSTNSATPVIIDVPPSWKEYFSEKAEKEDRPVEHLAVIDTTASSDDFDEYRTMVLFTEKSIVVPDDQIGYRVVPLDPEKDVEFTPETYNEILDTFLPFLGSLPALATAGVILLFFILPFIIAGFGWLWYLGYLAVFSLVAWLLAAIMGRRHTYAEIYKLGCFALTLPLIYSTIAGMALVLHLPFIFTLIFLVWMGIVFGSEKVLKRKTA